MCSLDNPSISEACLMKYRGLGFASFFLFFSSLPTGPEAWCFACVREKIVIVVFFLKYTLFSVVQITFPRRLFFFLCLSCVRCGDLVLSLDVLACS